MQQKIMYMAIEVMQWIWIVLVGLITSTQIDFANDLYRLVFTIVSMTLGTIVSYFVKKWLNRKKK